MQNSACLTTFLSAMLIGLNVISGSCISKLIGRKFTSFVQLCFHFSWKLVACLDLDLDGYVDLGHVLA